MSDTIEMKIYAYLILTINLETNERTVDIWSGKPWTQSRSICGTISTIAFEHYVIDRFNPKQGMSGDRKYFGDAKREMMESLKIMSTYPGSTFFKWAYEEMYKKENLTLEQHRANYVPTKEAP